VCLWAGALLAVRYEGLFRLVFAAAGFFGYVYFFTHALKEFGLSNVLVEGRPSPDGEVRTAPVSQGARKTTDRSHDFAAAA
jgi:hypothetical protein